MAVKRIKLANLVFDPAGFLSHAYGLSFRPVGKSWGKYDAVHDCLVVSGTVDFSTYFNALPVAKWRQYCQVRSARLHLNLKGAPCKIRVMAYGEKGGRVSSTLVGTKKVDASDEFRDVEIDLSFGDSVMIGFRLVCEGVCQVSHSYYYALVDENRLRSVRLGLCMTTHDKDVAAIPNLHVMAEGIFKAYENAADHLKILLVDQRPSVPMPETAHRKSLEEMVGELSLPEGAVEILPTPVVGSTGFVARSMMQALSPSENFTHLVIVGRNYKIHPETISRLYTMLVLLAPEHALSVVCGGTFTTKKPSVQVGDVFCVSPQTGAQKAVKQPLNLSRLADTVINETIDVKEKGAYAPWRLACLPVPLIRDQGYPLPFFLHCDDVEYGMRSNPECLVMSGIGCWDADRASRLGESVNCYQYVRNILVANAVNNSFREDLFMLGYWRQFRSFLRRFDYTSAELWLDGLEDYLKGPRFLATANGREILHQKSDRDARLLPLSELPSGIADKVAGHEEWLQDRESPSVLSLLVEAIPHDPHYLPDFILRKKPGVVGLHGNGMPISKMIFCSSLVALDESGTHGCLRSMDRDRYHEIWERAEELRYRFRNSSRYVAQLYQDQCRSLCFGDFWLDNLAK
ncbi:MAG: hypothetical protein PUE49_00265 [Eggerthellales bacterium]|nr:hypothetical protein [Eggerthellales bacterium]